MEILSLLEKDEKMEMRESRQAGMSEVLVVAIVNGAEKCLSCAKS